MSSTTPFLSKKTDSLGSLELLPRTRVLSLNLVGLSVTEVSLGQKMGTGSGWVEGD